MADFTTTTNLNLKKPAVGGSSDKWGEYLNSDLDTIDTEIQSLKTASTSRSLESLSNVLDLTPTTGQLLQYDTANWKAATVTIPEDIEDLSNVTVSSPADGEVLAWSASNARWENQSAGVATIPAGSITTAKLSTSLQGQVNLILQTTGNPTDDQILRYNATTSRWEFQDLPGGTISALSDTDVSGIANQDVLVYNSTSGDWVSRPLVIADVTGLQTSLDAKLESSDLSVSSLTDTTITTTADNSFLVYDASDSKWKNEAPSTARTSLGLVIGTDVQAYDADTTKNDVSNTFSVNQIISVADNTNAALRITQTGSGNALVVEDDTNPDSTPFVVKNNGKVSIGSDASLSSLFGTSPKLSVSDIGAPITLESIGDNQYGSRIDFIKTRGASSNSKTIVNNNDTLGVIYFGGSDGTSSITSASIVSQIDGTPGTNDMPGRLIFATTAVNASSATERMRITSAGNVGIGTTSPAERLDVTGNINATGALTLGTALAIAEGGTGATDAATARTNLDVDQAGTDNSTDVSLVTTSHDYLSIAGQAITLGPIDLAADVTGNLPYASISGTPTLGTAAAEDVGYFATAAQGALAGSAVQPGDDANTLGSGAATDGYVLTADGAGNAAWEAASGGGGGTTAYLEHSGTISDSFTVTSGTNRMYIGGTTFSGTITVAGRLVIVGGEANFTGTINTTGVLAILGVP